MNVDEEVDGKIELDLWKKDLLKRYINECPDVPQAVQGMLKETWQQELQEIEQRRNDLLPEHQKMQKRSKKAGEPTRLKETVPEGFGQVGWRQ